MNEKLNGILLSEGILEITQNGFGISLIPRNAAWPDSAKTWLLSIWDVEHQTLGFDLPGEDLLLLIRTARNRTREIRGLPSLEQEALDIATASQELTPAPESCPNCGQKAGLYRWARIRLFVPFADQSRELLDLQAPIEHLDLPLGCPSCERSFIFQK